MVTAKMLDGCHSISILLIDDDAKMLDGCHDISILLIVNDY